ncbi:Probable L-gulonolactone oxidase 6 [Ancistrocladus abbreviatus]
MSRSLLFVTSVLLLLCIAFSNTEEDPITCLSTNKNCTITNSYGVFPDRSICRAADVAYPSTEDELIDVVANGTMNRRKMKVATRYSHSIPKLVCPGDGQLQDNGLLISTRKLDQVLGVDKAAHTMTVQSGVTLRQFIDEAANAGLALPYTPYWWGLTIGGLLSTGSHGSSLWGNGSAVHDYVVGMRIVSPGNPTEGYVKVRTLNETDQDLNAAKVSLGVLGVISQVTLKLEPLFKRSITYKILDDHGLGDQAPEFGSQHEFADMSWYPSQRKVAYRQDDRVPSIIPGNGLNDFFGFRAQPSIALTIIRATEETQEARRDAEGKCVSAELLIDFLEVEAYGLTNNGLLFTGYPVVGYQNRLQASGTCLESPDNALITLCPWDPRVKGEFFFQTTFSISLSKVKAFIQDVQKLVALEPKSMCGTELYNGILMRYVKASSAYLGKQEDALDFDITYYRSHDPLSPCLYEDILEEIEQIGLFKYGGAPHWGKNRNLAFEGVVKKYKNAARFLEVKKRYDPLGLFSSDWTDQVLGIKGNVTIVKEGCALEGLCICSKDSHCAPNKGYFCKSGKIYEEARVCALQSN